MSQNENVKGRLPDVRNFVIQQHENNVSKTKKNYPGFRKNCIHYVQRYTNHTHIHGWKYIGEQDRPVFERLCWCISFIVSLSLCIYLVMETWNKWNTTPVIVTFAKTPTSIWNIPFPAVTVCPQTKSRQRMFNYTDTYNKFMSNIPLNEEQMKNFSASSLVCDSNLYTDGNKTTELTAIDHIIEVAPKLKDSIDACSWMYNYMNCSMFFNKIITEDGLCYTTNMLDRSQLFKNNVYLYNYTQLKMDVEGWSLEDGYSDTAKMNTFPRRVISDGFRGSLVLLLVDYEQDLDYVCKSQLQGFKIILHQPTEIPRSSNGYYQAPLNQELLISITPEMITTSKTLKPYDAYKRECFFPDEKVLFFFNNYTQQNCHFECLTNHTLKKCGCVAYYMPHEKSTHVCGSGSLNCIKEAQAEIMRNYADSRTSESNNQILRDGNSACDCLPACTSLTYNGELSQSEFNWRTVLQVYRENMTKYDGVQLTRITIFFKQPQFNTSERNELYGLTDFLAHCGGILGLFTGFSFLSIVELIYFLSLRLICNFKIYGKHYWSGSPTLLKDDAYLHY